MTSPTFEIPPPPHPRYSSTVLPHLLALALRFCRIDWLRPRVEQFPRHLKLRKLSESNASDIFLDVPEAISIRKVKLKNSGKQNLRKTHFPNLEYLGEFSFLVTANQTEPYLTGCTKEQQNFTGNAFPERVGKQRK